MVQAQRRRRTSFRVGAVGARGGADEVDEEDGHDLALLAARRLLRERSPEWEREARAPRGSPQPQLGQTITARVYKNWHEADTSPVAISPATFMTMDEARSVLRPLEQDQALERRSSRPTSCWPSCASWSRAEAWVRVEPGTTDGAGGSDGERLRQAVGGP